MLVRIIETNGPSTRLIKSKPYPWLCVILCIIKYHYVMAALNLRGYKWLEKKRYKGKVAMVFIYNRDQLRACCRTWWRCLPCRCKRTLSNKSIIGHVTKCHGNHFNTTLGAETWQNNSYLGGREAEN